MKTIIKKQSILWLLLGVVFLMGCPDLEVLNECNIDTDIIIDPDATCVPVCRKTFRLRDVDELPEGRRISWSLFKETEEIILPEPNAPEFSYDFDRSGKYNVIVQLSFDFDGCDEQLNRMFTIGVPTVVADIDVDTVRCVVGECELTFTSQSTNADTWIWKFPDDPRDFQGDTTVVYGFYDRPGVFQVILIAINAGGSSQDTATIFVDPATFDSSFKVGTGDAEKVMCVEEAANGSFFVIGNTKEESYIASVSRDGDSILTYDPIPKTLLPTYSLRTILDCHQAGDYHIMVGSAKFGTFTNDVYIVAVDNQFSTGFERAYFTPQNGDEEGRDIVRINNGYLICGNKSSGTDQGMLFIRLDDSFKQVDEFILFTGDPSNSANSIKKIENGYAVAGRLRNPGTGSREGCFFLMDENMDTIESSLQFYGNFVPEELIRINDGTFVMIGRNGATAQVIAFGDFNWDVPFGLTEIKKGKITSDGNLILVGGTVIGEDLVPNILKLDITTGGVLKEGKFRENGVNRKLLAVDETAENGVISGGLSEDQNENMILIRTNSKLEK